jgi:hypothetical protein
MRHYDGATLGFVGKQTPMQNRVKCYKGLHLKQSDGRFSRTRGSAAHSRKNNHLIVLGALVHFSFEPEIPIGVGRITLTDRAW